MQTAAYLRRFLAKGLSEYLAVPLCCLTAFLSFFYFIYLFFNLFFFFPFRTRMSLHRQAPQRGPKKKKKKNAVISASRGSDRWDVKQKHRKKGSLFAKLWKTDTPLWCKISFSLLCFLLYTDGIFQQCVKANVVSIVLSVVVQLIVTLLHGFKL